MTSVLPASEPDTHRADGSAPSHVAIIMDGNGRWARQQNKGRSKGHEAGVEALRRTVEAAGDLGVEYLTVYAFSTENWSRPKKEVNFLLALLKMYVTRDVARLDRAGVKVRMIGRRDNLDDDILKLITSAEDKTKLNSKLTLNIAFNYGGRSEIVQAVKLISQQVKAGDMTAEQITEDTFSGFVQTAGQPDPDLIIRTSGEARLSNFLMWQSAYSELLFLDVLWPDFGRSHLEQAIETYNTRDRRYGAITS